MGVNFTGISIKGECPVPVGNPNPGFFRIEWIEEVGPHAIVLVRYPGTRNYEGRKIILYLDTPAERIRSARSIDPHFTDEDADLKPFARFEPTQAAWAAAKAVAQHDLEAARA